jgi:hypothetical protein
MSVSEEIFSAFEARRSMLMRISNIENRRFEQKSVFTSLNLPGFRN